ncbi:MAG: UDP-N-acetylglucosamine--N-acetylmuramyl-(pentapeptide) pyrophosphoryl-undecaprenol N-acetylglucosamine transferase [Planctomycetota bacterium]|nr:UDP-N-acetylglucosamine--N-acetylmuramyl-(pentapeptide) pyrophosphoryl-undecaprenol N-acetylglucosamine transferase [Planctomycetota bacterium]
MAPQVFIFAGGGTGGHLYPGLAIAREILARDGSARCVFICSDKALDAEILGHEGVEFHPIPARPLSVRPKGLIRLIWNWGKCVRTARGILRGVKEAGAGAHVVSMGGYVSAPIAQAARVERVPVTLVNLDAVPGKANRWIARRAAHRFTAAVFPGAEEKGFRVIPPVVRAEAVAKGEKAACRAALGLDPARRTLLVTGASQGATSINAFMARMAERSPEAFEGWQVFHQAGPSRETVGGTALADVYRGAGIDAVVVAFCHDMASAWGSADLAVSRAGAGSVAEAWANGTPTLFLPYPYHRDEHQRHNAAQLESAGAAVIVRDRIDADANVREAGETLGGLLTDGALRELMAAAMRGLGAGDGAGRVATHLLSAAKA